MLHLIEVEGVTYHDYRPDVRFAIIKAMEENWDLFHCQAVDTFECRAMPDDPSKHRYQRASELGRGIKRVLLRGCLLHLGA